MTTTLASAVPLPQPEDIKLVVCDVDGTLLTEHHLVHPTTKRAFAALRAARPELPIVIASGKQYPSCESVRAELGLPPSFPAIHGHGALLHGPGGELLKAHPLPPAAIAHVAEEMRGRAVFLFTSREVVLVNKDDSRDWVAAAKQYDKNVFDASEAPARAEYLARVTSGAQPIVKICVAVELDEAEAVFAQLESHQRALVAPSDTAETDPPFHMTRAIPWIIELVPTHINKARAVSELCEELGIDMRHVLAFGDGDNDASMLAAVGHGVAMGNAMPEPKRRAKYVTATHNEGGVGVFLNAVYGFEADAPVKHVL